MYFTCKDCRATFKHNVFSAAVTSYAGAPSAPINFSSTPSACPQCGSHNIRRATAVEIKKPVAKVEYEMPRMR